VLVVIPAGAAASLSSGEPLVAGDPLDAAAPEDETLPLVAAGSPLVPPPPLVAAALPLAPVPSSPPLPLALLLLALPLLSPPFGVVSVPVLPKPPVDVDGLLQPYMAAPANVQIPMTIAIFILPS
jgi:hypothetical protein